MNKAVLNGSGTGFGGANMKNYFLRCHGFLVRILAESEVGKEKQDKHLHYTTASNDGPQQ